jgi:spore germination cell wall hydrolase CwlJ-like protein
MKYFLLFFLFFTHISFASEEAQCLAEAIYFESRNQPLAGQLAVGLVTLNRVKHQNYPNTVCGVVKQAKLDSGGKIIRHKCQFSFYCDGKEEIVHDDYSWDKASLIAHVLLAGMPDFTNNSIYYHSTKVNPSWASSFQKTMSIQDHIFYTEQ